ncbi:MAG: acyl carrier protein [Planctomycetota bacterium]|jgi:acyl carrier protein
MTSKEEITTKVTEIFVKTLKVDPEKLKPETALRDDLQLDSLDMIEVVYELEDTFDVQIPEDRVQEITTFQQVVDGLQAAIEAKAG